MCAHIKLNFKGVKMKAILILSVLALTPSAFGNVVYDARLKHQKDQSYSNELGELLKVNTSDAYNLLGEIYYFGWGVKVDFNKAKQFFDKATSMGHAAAANHLGRMYVNGEGSVQDLDQGVKYFALAESRGYPGAAANKATWEWQLNLLRKGMQQEIIQGLSKNSDPESLNFVGEIYHFGYGVTVDYEMARKYYEMAVALKSAKAANHLGRIYSNGEGVTKDLQKVQMYYDMEKNLNLN